MTFYLLKRKRKESEFYDFEVYFTWNALCRRKMKLEEVGEYVTSACVHGTLDVDKSATFIADKLVEDFRSIK